MNCCVHLYEWWPKEILGSRNRCTALLPSLDIWVALIDIEQYAHEIAMHAQVVCSC